MIYCENVINCTGMADNDWENQFKNSILPAFRDNVFHRQNLIKQKDKLSSLNNGLIIPDECHIASGSKMTIAKILKGAGILDINVLTMRNIKMLDISATPDAVLHDYKKWEDRCRIVKIKPGPSYKGFEVMLNENRIIDAPMLEEIADYYTILEFLEERYKNTSKKYFPFRLLDLNKIRILESVCDDLGWSYLNHNSGERIDKIDTLMENPPIKHTIIFIKGFWRASKRISHNHIGATYEGIPKKRDVSVTAQALTARFCDNYEYSGDQLDINLRPLHYCDKGAIEEYVEWFNNNCDFNISKYKSHRISSNGKGKVSSKETKVNPKNVSGINDFENTNLETTATVPIIVNITDDEYRSMKRQGKRGKWDYSTILPLIQKYKPDIIPELQRIENSGGKDQFVEPYSNSTYAVYITDFVNAFINNKCHKHIGNIKDKTKDTFQIYFDKPGHRIIISIQYGSKTPL